MTEITIGLFFTVIGIVQGIFYGCDWQIVAICSAGIGLFSFGLAKIYIKLGML